MKTIVGGAIEMLCVFMITGYAYAGDAEVLPKGRFALNVDYKHYFPWTKRFDTNGHEQDAAADFNTVLNSNVIPGLDAFNGLVPGTPNIGRSVVTFKYSYERIEPTLAYGITDKLSVGLRIPYIWYQNEVTARLDSSNANIGKNPAFNPQDPTSPPLIPIAMGGVPLTTQDIQNLLGSGLVINGALAIPGFGYKYFGTWRDEGFGDLEAGLKYQYYNSENWRLAGLFGALFPTGKVADPDNLAAQPLGGGSYGLIFRSYNDFTGIKNFVINGSVFYTLTLPQDDERRIVSDPHKPLTAKKEKVTIDPGDVVELETSVKYQLNDVPFLRGTSLELLYHYTHYFRDSVTAPDGQHIPSLETQTEANEHSYIVKLSYSTIPLYLNKKFPIPLDLSLAYRNKFAGNNDVFETEYLETSLTVYF